MKSAKRFILFLVDVVMIQTSVLLAIILLDTNHIPQLLKTYLKIALLFTLLYITIFSAMKLYRSLWRYAGTEEILYILIANILGSFIAIPSFGWIMNYKILSISSIMICFFSLFTRLVLRFLRREIISFHTKKLTKQFKRTLIVGAGQGADIFIKESKNNRRMQINPILVVDDNPYKIGHSIGKVPVKGKISDIPYLVRKYNIENIILAIPSLTQARKKEIISLCTQTQCKVQMMPTYQEIIKDYANIKQIRDVELEDLLGRDAINLDNSEVLSFLKNKKIMITGAGGSIGSELVRQVLSYHPQEILLLDNYENSIYDLHTELTQHTDIPIHIHIGSIQDRPRMESLFSVYRPQIVFHAAAHKHVPLMENNPSEAVKNNIFGTLNLIELSHTYRVEKFIMISTDKAVNPTSVMGMTKRVCEMLVQSINKQSKTEFVSVRFGNVLGSNGSVIPLFKKQIQQGGPITLTHKDITRYFMLIPEAVQLVLQAGAFAKGGEVFVLDMGKPIKIYDLALDLIKLSGLIPFDDIDIVITGLRPGEKLYEELLMDEEGLQQTENNKIFIGQPIEENYGDILRKVQNLKIIIQDNELLVHGLKQIVTTAITSDYEKEVAATKAI